MSNLNELAYLIHRQAKDMGWWDNDRGLPELLMLTVSELSEAMEADRKGRWAKLDPEEVESCCPDEDPYDKDWFERHVKDTVQDEIADAIIRLLDLCGHYDIPIAEHVAAKLAYNRTRGKRHGKKY